MNPEMRERIVEGSVLHFSINRGEPTGTSREVITSSKKRREKEKKERKEGGEDPTSPHSKHNRGASLTRGIPEFFRGT